jgi:hypothetical protein
MTETTPALLPAAVESGVEAPPFADRTPGKREDGCPLCGGTRFWRSLWKLTCATCYPPAHPGLTQVSRRAPPGARPLTTTPSVEDAPDTTNPARAAGGGN